MLVRLQPAQAVRAVIGDVAGVAAGLAGIAVLAAGAAVVATVVVANFVAVNAAFKVGTTFCLQIYAGW